MRSNGGNVIKTREFLGLAIATDAFDDGAPRCRDIDLGRFLGYARPRDVRKLIERELKAKNLNDSDVRATVARKERRAGKHPAFKDSRAATVEYWLTESASLFVASRAETKTGAEVLKALIQSWMAARQDQRVINIIEECWGDCPRKTQTMFTGLIVALLNMRGELEEGDRLDQTPPWARLLASMIYRWAFGSNDETNQQRHRRGLEPKCKRPDYWWLNEKGRRQIQKVIATGEDYAINAASWDQWVAMMVRRFEGGPLQLFFGQSNKRLPPKPKSKGKAA